MGKKGYTLIEVVCVVGIIAILSGICMCSVKDISKTIKEYNFKHTCINLVSDLRYAKTYAQSHGRVKFIFYDNGYEICNYSSEKTLLKSVKFTKDINIEYVSVSGPKEISFTEYGTVCPSACSISIKNDEGFSKIITIKPITYAIDFKKGDE